jgi:hypothetical protein
MSTTGAGPADADHQYELNQIDSLVSEVADFFHDFPGSLPEQEEDIENKTREALERLFSFVTERWGS